MATQNLNGTLAAQAALGADQTVSLGEVEDGNLIDSIAVILPPGAANATGPGAGNGVRFTVRQLRAGVVIDAALGVLNADSTVTLKAEQPFVAAIDATLDTTAGGVAQGSTKASELLRGDELDVVVHQIGGTGLAVPAGTIVQAHLS